MTVKTWTVQEIRALARQTIDGKKAIATARGAYFRALIETTQAELGGKADQAAQMTALKAVHRRFYATVTDAIATDDLLLEAGVPRKRLALERNRRTNFARSAYGTIRRWLRAHGHSIEKLDAKTVTKSQLLNEAPPTRKHALTTERIQKKARKLVEGLVGFAAQVAKADQAQAEAVLAEAIVRLQQQMGGKPTTDAKIAVREHRPLKVDGTVFVPASVRRLRAVA